MKRRLLTAAVVLALPAFALAQDEKVLSGSVKDDIAFAKALQENGYPDLAERLLIVVEKKGGGGAEAAAAIRAVKLDVAQDNASKIEDLVKRKDALVKVLNEKIKFIDESKGTTAAIDVRNVLPDLYDVIGTTVAAAIKKEKDDTTLAALRAEADAIFQRAEQAARNRVAEIKAIETKTEEDEYQLAAAEFNVCRTVFFHAQIFAPGSGKRAELSNQAINEYQEFDLNYSDSRLNYYGYIDTGLCYKDLGKPDDAVGMFDLAIKVRDLYGEPVKGVYQIPREIIDVVCYAMLQKMVLFREQKQPAKVVPVGKEYFATVPEPWGSQQSAAVAKEMAEAQLLTGDLKGAAETAKAMIDIDPNGYVGQLGREIRDRSGAGSFSDTLKSAESKIAANEFDVGLSLARKVMYDTAGTPDEAEAGCEALLLIGSGFQRRGWVEEAALAYQTAVDRYPKAKAAPEALIRAIDCYNSAQGKTGRRKYYREHVDEGWSRFIRDYPNDPRAGNQQISKARNLEGEGDFLGAIQIYKSVKPASTDYTKSLLMIGIGYFNHARNVAQQVKDGPAGKPDEEAKKKAEADAKPFYPLAEAAFKDAITAIRAARSTTLDPKILSAYNEQEYLATMSLAKLYMIPAFGRSADAPAVIDTLEQSFSKDPAKGPEIQNLRGRGFLSQGKFEEAEKWVDDLFKRDPVAAAGPAGQLARELDRQGQEKRQAKPGSAEADDLWKRAARYYYISVRPQITGVTSQKADELAEVGNRMYVYGLVFNAVPDAKINFVDFAPGPKSAPDFFVKAAEIYKAALEQTPDYRMAINLGRAYGFLNRWVDAAGVYSKLFDQEPILNQKDKRKLDPVVTRAKNDLVSAYLEWGVAERMAFAADADKDRLLRARDVIFTPLANTLKHDSLPEVYWGARYHLVRTLMDRGEYKDAKLSVDDIQRQVSPTFDDDKFGYKSRFEATIEELKKLLR